MTKTHKYGSTLRAIRSARGLSLSVLSEKSGIHTSVLSRLETGSREPRTVHLQKLAAAFRFSFSGLVKKLEAKG